MMCLGASLIFLLNCEVGEMTAIHLRFTPTIHTYDCKLVPSLAAHTSDTILIFLPQDGGTGTVTPGNASPMTDGAAALVLASRARAQQLGLPVLAVIRGHADANQAPEW